MAALEADELGLAEDLLEHHVASAALAGLKLYHAVLSFLLAQAHDARVRRGLPLDAG